MKMSSLDFLADLEKRLDLLICGPDGVSALEVHRFLNFAEKTQVVKMSLAGELFGKLTCRMVEEPQDFYFRGTYQHAADNETFAFTLRPGTDYEKDMGGLVEAIVRSSQSQIAETIQADAPKPAKVSPPTKRAAKKPKGVGEPAEAASE